MDGRAEIRDFLTTRRARITPEGTGLPTYGGHRRVAGLRREEVALLAGVSVDYYIRLERGNLTGVSDSVLEAVARALRLDEAERAHLFDLARAANLGPAARARRPRAPRLRPQTQRLRPQTQRLLDVMVLAPAYVRNSRLDILGANALGRAVFAPLFDTTAATPNIARFIFLDAAAQAFYRDWDELAGDVVAMLRAEAGRDPHARAGGQPADRSSRSMTDASPTTATRPSVQASVSPSGSASSAPSVRASARSEASAVAGSPGSTSMPPGARRTVHTRPSSSRRQLAGGAAGSGRAAPCR